MRLSTDWQKEILCRRRGEDDTSSDRAKRGHLPLGGEGLKAEALTGGRWENLQIFAEAAEAAAAGDGGTIPETAPEAAGQTGDAAVSDTAGQPQGAEGGGKEKPPADRKAAFRAMIDGEFKDLYQDAVRSAVNRRLKNTEADVARLGKLGPSLDLLAHRYQFDPAQMDPDALYQKMLADDVLFEDRALAAGRTTEEERQSFRLESETRAKDRRIAELESQLKSSSDQEAQRAFNEKMDREIGETRAKYQDFDFGAWANAETPEGDTFRKLLRNGFSVMQAYEFANRDALTENAIRYAVEHTAEKITDSVRSGANRPRENGMRKTAPAETHLDPNKMTREERQALIERARRGERITF